MTVRGWVGSRARVGGVGQQREGGVGGAAEGGCMGCATLLVFAVCSGM